MYKGLLHTHLTAVIIFMLIYVVKTILLLSNKNELLASFTKKTRIAEMVVSILFLVTGIYLGTQIPLGGKYAYLFYIKLCMVFASIPIAIIGFKKSNKILAALSLFLIVGSYGLAESFSRKKGIMAGESFNSELSGGKALYENNCRLCHGDNGKLGMAGAKDLSTSAMSVEEIKNVILNGNKTMAPVSVNDAQAAAIAAYVSENLKGK